MERKRSSIFLVSLHCRSNLFSDLWNPVFANSTSSSSSNSGVLVNGKESFFGVNDSISLEEILDWSSKTFIFCLYISDTLYYAIISATKVLSYSKSYIPHLASRTMFLFLVLIAKHCLYNFFNINYRLYFNRNFQILNCSFIGRLFDFKRNLKSVLGIFPLSTSVLPSVASSIPRLLASAFVSDKPCLFNK